MKKSFKIVHLTTSFLLLPAIACIVGCNKATPLLPQTGGTGTTTNDSLSQEVVTTSPSSSGEAMDTVLTIAFVGDVLMGTNFPDESYVTKDHGRSLFMDCKDVLSAADIAIANLEGTCYDGTEGEPRKGKNPKTTYIFRMPGDHAQNLVEAGIDIVNFANNHSFDFGKIGREKTLAKMAEVGIKVSGIKDLAEAAIVERQGKKVAYVSFAASCTQVNDLNNDAEVKRLVGKYRALADLLIVGFHGGAEGDAYSHVPKKTETFLGECRGDVMKFAHLCIDNGADIVVGHGPHVPRAMELYRGHLIAYSLGNFCGPYRLGTGGLKSQAPLLVASVRMTDGSFSSGRIHSYLQVPGVGPRFDKNHTACRTISSLTASDFPATPLSFGPNGEVTVMGIR